MFLFMLYNKPLVKKMVLYLFMCNIMYVCICVNVNTYTNIFIFHFFLYTHNNDNKKIQYRLEY